MPRLAAENNNLPPSDEKPGQGLATVAELLYLFNLLLLPGIAFIILLLVYMRYRNTSPPLAVCHLRQTVSASIWAGVMLVLVNALIILLGGYDSPSTWIVVILYFTTIHATLILLGSLGLAKAMANKHYHFPLIGRSCSGE
ncbi:hypothetical protein [Sulfuriflexus mobilis]|uniref:hypothetical protein n=1 Tax=Sulfuriflexus mobilis TaxID=1811807 RepID=UPI000F83CACE|nr:hypothetical protein [Sulfuriflexus mobilis]